ncbi:hypothetical protein [Ottowia massiliensis]|uniref:hypothetical protein n=1 Tax=Ottowia massiliensis TaxID=2045302 RepID=UPI0011AED8EB|nr:hypothetical protein [Ottowia massiliensis]
MQRGEDAQRLRSGKISGALYTEYRPEYSFIIKENPDPPSENPLTPFLQQMKLPCLCNPRETAWCMRRAAQPLSNRLLSAFYRPFLVIHPPFISFNISG